MTLDLKAIKARAQAGYPGNQKAAWDTVIFDVDDLIAEVERLQAEAAKRVFPSNEMLQAHKDKVISQPGKLPVQAHAPGYKPPYELLRPKDE